MEIFIILAGGVCGALITFLLNNQLQLGGVMASSGISMIAAGFFFIFPNMLSPYLTINLPIVIMGASFIGMATLRIVSQLWIIGVSGLFFSLIYLFTGTFFEGYGGSLGSTAAISLCSVYALDQLKDKILPLSK